MTNTRETLNAEEIYNEFFPSVYNYVFYRLLNKENTEDIVSQVFIKVVANLEKFDPEKASVKTWIFRITDNTLIDYYRKRRVHLSMDDDANGLSDTLKVDFDEQYNDIFSPDRKAVYTALTQLNERDRMFIYFKYYKGITNRAIAKRFDMNESTVAAILARARKKLKLVLDREFE